MGNQQEENSVPNQGRAKIVADATTAIEKRAKRFSLIWVIPILALLLAGILIWQKSFNTGLVINLETNSASGIEAGKTLVKMRSVSVGTVTKISFSDNYKSTILTIQMNKGTDDLLREDSSFWVVRPRIENTGISGLDTLLSGSYIELNLGKKVDTLKTNYTALNEPPVRLDDNGLMVELSSIDNKSLSVGDVVTYRGFNVGAIANTSFDIKSGLIKYEVFIRSPYSDLVNHSTRFWINSGIDVALNSTGLTVNTDSLDNIIVGGISFENFIEPSNKIERLQDKEKFILFSKKADARLSALENELTYVVLLDQSLYKLAEGSAVTYNGVQVGEVINAPWLEDRIELFQHNTLPVRFALYTTAKNRKDFNILFNSFLKQSRLCAKIGSTNVVLSDNQIDLVLKNKGQCNVEKLLGKREGIYQNNGLYSYKQNHIIPLVTEQSLMTQLNEFAEKLNRFDVEGISNDLKQSLQAITVAMNAFTKSNNSVSQNQMIEKISIAFENLNNTVQGFGPNTKLYKSLNDSLKNIEQLLQDLSPSVSQVGQNPSSVIFGVKKDIVPTAPKEKNK